MARQDLIKYVRTDKNGTKYFLDYTCPRCAGAGEADKWMFTGRTCFACGGSGMRAKPITVKKYTDEYFAKLQARRQERGRKYAEEHADEIAQANAERERREAEWKKAENIRSFRQFGCNEDGTGFVHIGNTYPIKEQIKANGGKWIARLWVCPVVVEAEDVKAVKINLNDFINEYGMVDEFEAQEAIWEIGGRR